jgi:hypothetical protein
MSFRIFAISAAVLSQVIPTIAFAGCDLDNFVGYTLIASKYVAAHFDKGDKKDGFEGCAYNRVLVFDDQTGVRCTGYSYHYAYHPKAYVFSNGSSMKACIDDSVFDVGPLR